MACFRRSTLGQRRVAECDMKHNIRITARKGGELTSEYLSLYCHHAIFVLHRLRRYWAYSNQSSFPPSIQLGRNFVLQHVSRNKFREQKGRGGTYIA